MGLVSPSDGFEVPDDVIDLGIGRLRDVFGLQAVEYPTTRRTVSEPLDRAADLMDAFLDPTIKALISTVGGMDQLRVLRHLDQHTIADNPKLFFGFSDNTHLQCFLWTLGIPSRYGGCLATELAARGGIDDFTSRYLTHAMFGRGEVDLESAACYDDSQPPWSYESMPISGRWEHNEGWQWSGEGSAEGRLFGGCVESLVLESIAHKYLPVPEDLDGCVLFLETASDDPEPWVMHFLLMGLGERGVLDRAGGLLVGRPIAWHPDGRSSPSEKAARRAAQRRTVLDVTRNYNPTMPIVQNMDFGHTHPQIPLPNGGVARIDRDEQRVVVTY